MKTFNKAVQVVLNLEGGHSLDPNDSGNWTGGQQGVGELKGTKFGISAAAYPFLDIENITKQEAIDLYHQDYWRAAGCDMLTPALAVLVFDTAVNSGVATAQSLLRESSNLLDYIARRFQHYAGLTQFDTYGKGWTRRFATVVQFAATLESSPDSPTVEGLVLTYDANGDMQHQQAVPGEADILIRVKGAVSRVHVRPDKPE